MPHYTALVTVLVACLYVFLGTQVSRAHRQYGVKLPSMSGNVNFERVYRAHINAVEWLPIFLPPLWLFAYYVNDKAAALLGLVWIAGRVWYFLGYREGADKRFPGFLVQAVVCLILMAGALIGVVMQLLKG